MIIGYPTPNKAKAKMILDAFCAGCEGMVAGGSPRDLFPNDAAFFGVTPSTQRLWHQAKATKVAVYYGDNAYLDPCRGTYFRFTKDRLQADGRSHSTGARFAKLGLPIAPWRRDGKHILVCPQSDEFMSVVCDYFTNWTKDTVESLKQVTTREIRVRPWNRDKAAWFATLGEDLEDCWCVVTYSSSSAISALRAGVPAICMSDDCIAAPWCKAPLATVDQVERNYDRRPLFHVAADNQWSVDEMRDGTCWRMMNG